MNEGKFRCQCPARGWTWGGWGSNRWPPDYLLYHLSHSCPTNRLKAATVSQTASLFFLLLNKNDSWLLHICSLLHRLVANDAVSLLKFVQYFHFTVVLPFLCYMMSTFVVSCGLALVRKITSKGLFNAVLLHVNRLLTDPGSVACCALQKPEGSTSKPKCFPIVCLTSRRSRCSFRYTGTHRITHI